MVPYLPLERRGGSTRISKLGTLGRHYTLFIVSRGSETRSIGRVPEIRRGGSMKPPSTTEKFIL